MIGAIVGDIVGSRFEFNNTNKKVFKLYTMESKFTDDTICTVAIADAITRGVSYKDSLQYWCRQYPNPMGGYGAMFAQWVRSNDPQPYNSWGNGSAMRVSAVGWAFDSLEKTLKEAEQTAIVSHNHPEGIKGAVCVAHAIYAMRTNYKKVETLEAVANKYYPEWKESKGSSRSFDESCQGVLPICLRSAIYSRNFEDAIRTAIACGGDSDTIAAITGSLAEALHGIPTKIYLTAINRLDAPINNVIGDFYKMLNNK